MKKLTKTLSAILAVTSFALPAAANAGEAGTPARSIVLTDGQPIAVTVGGSPICAGEAKLIATSTYVPLRSFCSEFGVTNLSWDAVSRTATVTAPGLSLRAVEGAEYIEVNDRAFHAPDGVRVENGVMLIPLRPLARAFGLEVIWDDATASVTLLDGGSGYVPAGSTVYPENDLYWLSRIVAAESRGEPMDGQLAVANVVLNRVASSEFPDTIEGVIFDRKYAVQFTPVANGTIFNEPDEASIIAAKLALEGYTLSTDIIYFLNPALSTSLWVPQNRPYCMTVGSHDFYA